MRVVIRLGIRINLASHRSIVKKALDSSFGSMGRVLPVPGKHPIMEFHLKNMYRPTFSFDHLLLAWNTIFEHTRRRSACHNYSLYQIPMPLSLTRSLRLARSIHHRAPVRHFSERRVIFSGIQPTGTPHIGNYVGAIQRWVRLQDEPADRAQLLYSVVDLHAITMPIASETLRRQRREAIASLLAAGIDSDRATLFYQSDVCLEQLAVHL